MAAKREKGRPRGGRVKFTRLKLSKLPEEGTLAEFAAVLKVSVPTIRNWVLMQALPADIERVEANDLYTLRREAFVEWAKRSGRMAR